MHVADQAHAASFTRFIDSEGESEVDFSTNLPVIPLAPIHRAGPNGAKTSAGQAQTVGPSGVRSNKCTHCRAQIFESTSCQSWKNERGTQVTLCGKCNQKYISGLVDNTSEHRKFTKYIQQLCGNMEPMPMD